MAIEHRVLRFKRNYVLPDSGDIDNYRYEFQAADGNVYTISGREEKAFPNSVAIEMLAANSNLEQVFRA